ncbi:hypothetical protein LB503_008504, partial [Fusarium chuoi]
MFAQFELYSGGWVHAEKRVKHRRSPGGCIPCRNRRKKCDESRPTCGSCSSRRVACIWRDNDERRSQKLLARAAERSPSRRLDGDSNDETSTPESIGDELILQNGSRLGLQRLLPRLALMLNDRTTRGSRPGNVETRSRPRVLNAGSGV